MHPTPELSNEFIAQYTSVEEMPLTSCTKRTSPVVRRNFARPVRRKDPLLRSLLHEPLFMMQAAEYGSLHNPVPGRQTVSVFVAAKLLRHRLRQAGA